MHDPAFSLPQTPSPPILVARGARVRALDVTATEGSADRDPDMLAEAPPFRWTPTSRLAERARDHGLSTLNEGETLELYLERRIPGGAAAAAQALLRRFGSLQRVLGASGIELQQVVSFEAALDLKLLHDLAGRILAFPFARRSVISSWSALIAYLRLAMAGQPRELFKVLFLDKKNGLIADEIMGEGTVDHAPVYPREVVRRALELNASALILCHQHPGGSPDPSQADIEITRKVKDAATALGIVLHDHVVVGGDDVASFRALGLI